MCLASEVLGEALMDEYVREKVRMMLQHYTTVMDKLLQSYILAAHHLMIQRYNVVPVIEFSTTPFEWGVEARVRMYLDSVAVARITEIAKKELSKGHVKLRVLRKILARELRESSGGIGALLPVVHTSPGEGGKEVGRGRTKVRGEKRRPTHKSPDESTV
jgi:hypothetical protein